MCHCQVMNIANVCPVGTYIGMSHFQDDPDIAKYLYKICTLHHKFYTGSRQSSL